MKCAAENKNLIQSIREQEREFTAKEYTILTATAGLEKCNLCQNTVAKLLKWVIYYADSINKGYIKLEDLQDALKNEHEFEIEFKTK